MTRMRATSKRVIDTVPSEIWVGGMEVRWSVGRGWGRGGDGAGQGVTKYEEGLNFQKIVKEIT